MKRQLEIPTKFRLLLVMVLLSIVWVRQELPWLVSFTIGKEGSAQDVFFEPIISPQQQACIANSSFHWIDWEPHENDPANWEVQANVQVYLKGHGRPTGLPSRCDWVFGGRVVYRSPRGIHPPSTAFGKITANSSAPRTIFISPLLLQAFHNEILPCLRYPVVLIIGDDDATTPRQVDMRFSAPKLQHDDWLQWVYHEKKRIQHIFVEHLDEATDPTRVSPIPLGFNPFEFKHNLSLVHTRAVLPPTRIRQRPLQAIMTNRLHWAPQFDLRRQTKEICETTLSELCVYKRPRKDMYLESIQEYPFQLCVHGGGIEPNPCVFSALLVAVIPIAEAWPGKAVYDDLPVVWVNFTNLASELTRERLRKELDRWEPHFEQPILRNETLRRLRTDYWWGKVQEQVSLVPGG